MKRYLGFIITILGVVGVLCIVSFYASDIELFIKLRAWDRAAPGRVVTDFLMAAKQGDPTETDRHIAAGTYKHLMKEDRVIGYFVTTQAGTMEFPFTELAPEGDVKINSVDLVLLGDGNADVSATGRKNTEAKFRLKMIDGKWKITEIRSGGNARLPPPPPGRAGPGP